MDGLTIGLLLKFYCTAECIKFNLEFWQFEWKLNGMQIHTHRHTESHSHRGFYWTLKMNSRQLSHSVITLMDYLIKAALLRCNTPNVKRHTSKWAKETLSSQFSAKFYAQNHWETFYGPAMHFISVLFFCIISGGRKMSISSNYIWKWHRAAMCMPRSIYTCHLACILLSPTPPLHCRAISTSKLSSEFSRLIGIEWLVNIFQHLSSHKLWAVCCVTTL